VYDYLSDYISVSRNKTKYFSTRQQIIIFGKLWVALKSACRMVAVRLHKEPFGYIAVHSLMSDSVIGPQELTTAPTDDSSENYVRIADSCYASHLR